MSNSKKGNSNNGNSKNDKTIIRVAKNKDNPYVMMNKTGLNDSRLSFKAKGILAYLLSKPDNWKVMVVDLIKVSTDGQRAIYSGLKELETYGYMKRKRVYRIDENTGRNVIDRWEMIVYETPFDDDQEELDIETTKDKKTQPFNEENYSDTSQTLENTDTFVLQRFVDLQNVDVQNVDVQNVDVQNVDLQNVDVQNATLLNNDYILNNDYTNNIIKERIELTDRRRAKKESPHRQGDNSDDVVPPLIKLKDQIEKLTGGKVQIQTLQRILSQPQGFEKINHAFNVYPYMRDYITRYQPIENTVGLFFYIAENMVDLPVSIRSTGKKTSFNNFEQHDYTEEELESLYEPIEQIE